MFLSNADAELAIEIYSRIPALNKQGSWSGLIFRQGLFNTTSDSHLFLELASDDAQLEGTQANETVRLYEAKMIRHFDHRYMTYEHSVNRARKLSGIEKANVNELAVPRYWIGGELVNKQLKKIGWTRKWFLGFRDVALAANERTVISAFLPYSAVGHTCPLLFFAPETANSKIACLLANFCSLIFDYLARQKIGGSHLTFSLMQQLPVLPEEHYAIQDIELICSRVLELTYTVEDMRAFAEDLGYRGEPFRWDPDRRASLRFAPSSTLTMRIYMASRGVNSSTSSTRRLSWARTTPPRLSAYSRKTSARSSASPHATARPRSLGPLRRRWYL